MSSIKKKRFFVKHAKASAAVISLSIHVLIIVAAFSLVAVQYWPRDEVDFEHKAVSRPSMKLRKLKVPVMDKKPQAPKLRKNIVAKPKIPQIDLQMPEIVGVPGAMGAGSGGGLASLGFDFDMDMDLFGSGRGTGSEFIGHFYDLKQTKDGQPSEIGKLIAKAESADWNKDPSLIEARSEFRKIVKSFYSGWKSHVLDNYFKAPREKYASAFIIPNIGADEAPRAFGVEDQVHPSYWVALYRGHIAAPESGRYRLCGRGDDVLAVRVNKKLVLDASFMNVSGWEGDDSNHHKYETCNNNRLSLGDWFFLKKGDPVEMDVLIGEEPGGLFFCQLYIQQQGVDYPTTTETFEEETRERPILPIFKTAVVPDKIIPQMELNDAWATVDGPIFSSGN